MQEPRLIVYENATLLYDRLDPSTGLSAYSGETIEQIRAKGYPDAESIALCNYRTLLIERQNVPVTWEPVDCDQFNASLGAVPPAYMGNKGFLVGEAMDFCAKTGKDRYTAYREPVDGQYYRASRPMTVAEFKAITL